MKDLARRFQAFVFADESDFWSFLLRVGLGAQVVFYCLPLRKEWSALLSSGAGLVDRRLPEIIVAGQSALIPQMNWFVLAGQRIGLGEQATLKPIWAILLVAGLALLAGLFTRASAITAWLLHLAAAKSGGLFAYGADNFMTIGLFYVMLAPRSNRLALDTLLFGRRDTEPWRIGFFRRLLQFHLCVVYFFSGLTKALGSDWWNGSNLWRALIRPPFEVISPERLAAIGFLLPVAGLAIWLIELTYPVFIWGERTRMYWLVMICAMHVTIGALMGMYLFALVMLVLNLAAFAPEFRGRGGGAG